MASIALATRALLALVFVVAAVGKLADQQGARRALADFGMPTRSLRPVAVLLPLAELLTAVALLVQPSARLGAVAALVLLAVFTAGIAAAMARGRTPDCHCFGQFGSAPAGPRTLVRNGLLAAASTVVLAYGPGDSIAAWVSARSAAELVAISTGIASVALAALCARLWLESKRLSHDLSRSRDALALFPAGLPIGAPAPAFSLPSVDRGTTTLDSLLGTGKPVALVFVSPNCPPCQAMMPDLARWQLTLADRITIALVVTGAIGEIRHLAEEHGLTNVLAQTDAEVLETYRAMASPAIVIVTPDGRIGSRTRSSRTMVEAVIRDVLSRDVDLPGLRSRTPNGELLDVRTWSSVGSVD